MKRVILALFFILLASGGVLAQDATDEPKVCISQTTANELYVLATKGKAFDEYKTQAEADIKARDKIIEDLKREVAMLTQHRIDSDAERQRLVVIIEALLKSVRPKKIGLINF